MLFLSHSVTQTEDLCYKRSSSALSNTLTTRERSKRVGQGRSPVLQRPRNARRSPSHSRTEVAARGTGPPQRMPLRSPVSLASGLCNRNSGNARRAWF